MIQKIAISPGQVKDYACMKIEAQGPLNGFPFVCHCGRQSRQGPALPV